MRKLAWTKELVPKEVRAGIARCDLPAGKIGHRRYIVVDAQPKIGDCAKLIIEPGTPEVDVGDGTGGVAEEIIGQDDAFAVINIEALLRLWQLDEFDAVGFRARRGLRPRRASRQDNGAQHCPDQAAARAPCKF